MEEPDAKEKQLISDFRATFLTESGATVLENLSHNVLENQTTFDIKTWNPLKSAYNEGARWVLLYIRSMIAKEPSIKRQQTAEE